MTPSTVPGTENWKCTPDDQAQGAAGPALEFSQRFGRWFGYTAHISYATLEFSRSERTRMLDSITTATVSREAFELWDETTIIPLFGVCDLHLFPPGRWDLHVGPRFGFSWYDDLFGGWVDDHFLYRLGTGLDVELGCGFALSTVVRFTQAEAQPREGGPLLHGTGEINVDPWQLSLGVAYRFDAPRARWRPTAASGEPSVRNATSASHSRTTSVAERDGRIRPGASPASSSAPLIGTTTARGTPTPARKTPTPTGTAWETPAISRLTDQSPMTGFQVGSGL